MLLERDVVDAVCKYLVARGYEIRQRKSESERGDDIIAVRGRETLYVEAKGETSSRPGSARHGKPFSANQVVHHVAMALYVAAKRRASGIRGVRVAIALPHTEQHVQTVASIQAALTDLDITTLWARADGSVVESR